MTLPADPAAMPSGGATAGSTRHRPCPGWQAPSVDQALFDQVAEAVRGLLPAELGELHRRARRYGLKVWFGPATPPREHYEAQVIGPDLVDDAAVLALEIGFHAEHPKVADNDRALEPLLEAERSWRKTLGEHAVAGPFLGRPDDWRRVSETWADPDLGDPELVIELASCLTDYITVLEPLRRRT
jgi:hypothetical protein